MSLFLPRLEEIEFLSYHLEATPHNAVVVRVPTSYLANHQSKTNKTCKRQAEKVRTTSIATICDVLLNMDTTELAYRQGLTSTLYKR